MDSNNTQILFGYGSLISDESRSRSFEGRVSYAAELRGHQRAWCAPIPGVEVTGLGLLVRPESRCGGVLIELSSSELEQADSRECVNGYVRVPLRWGMVESARFAEGADAGLSNWCDRQLWTYYSARKRFPSADKPIIQSYVDVVLLGVLARGLEFAEAFVKSTDGWNSPWVDDRSAPRYPRPLESTIEHARVDTLLRRLVPEALAHRVPI